MVKGKNVTVILGEKELKKIRDARTTTYDVTVKYRDGGVDDFHGLKSTRVMNNVLEIVESTSTTVYLVLSIITYIRVVEVKE